jgi:peptidoglycan/LPS O-acetylase OafA/YrhL
LPDIGDTVRSIGEVLRESKGMGVGFDTLRLVLASSVVFIHCSLRGSSSVDVDLEPLVAHLPIPTWALSTAAVPLFFALSGFLLAGSAEKQSLGTFAANRALRIFPALAVEIILCACLLGPLVTSLPLKDYFSSPLFFHYLRNIAGLIHYDLPGVFLNNPHTSYVNGSLWTVPHELSVYFMLGASIWLGVFRRPALLVAGLVVLLAAALAVFAAPAYNLTFPGLAFLTKALVTRGAARLVPVFFMGVVLHRYRFRVPYHGGFALAGLALYLCMTCVISRETMLSPIGVVLTAPIFAYIIAWAGLSSRFTLRDRLVFGLPVGLLVAGDYSYGIYLYGFPLQQTLLHFFPSNWSTITFFIASLSLALCVATLSWHFIERPMLRLRCGTAAPRSNAITLDGSPAGPSQPDGSLASASVPYAR